MCVVARSSLLLLVTVAAAVVGSDNVHGASTVVFPREPRSTTTWRQPVHLGIGSVRLHLPNNANGDELKLNAHDDLLLPCEGVGPLEWWTPHAADRPHAYSIVRLSNSNPSANATHRPLMYNDVNGNHTGLYCCSQATAHYFEEQNTDTRKCAYIYVVDPSTPFAEMFGEIKPIAAVQGREVTIPCRPSSPEISLELYVSGVSTTPDDSWKFDPRKGFTKIVTVVPTSPIIYKCLIKSKSKPRQRFSLTVRVAVEYVERPFVDAPLLLREGADLNFACSVLVPKSANISFSFHFQGINSTVPVSNFTTEYWVATDDKMMVRQGWLAHGVSAVGDGVSQICCKVYDHMKNENHTCRHVRVTSRGSPSEVRFVLDSQPPDCEEKSKKDGEGVRGMADAFVKTRRDPTFFWYVWLAWQDEKQLPVATWVDPDGVKKPVGDTAKKPAHGERVSVRWCKPLRDVKASAPDVALHNAIRVKVPTMVAEPGNYTLEVTVGKTKQLQPLELSVEGAPRPRLLNDSLTRTSAQVTCVARAHPHPDLITWFWVRCNDTQPCDVKCVGGGGGGDVEQITPKDATWEVRPYGHDTLLSTLKLIDPVVGRWLRCQAMNTHGTGCSRSLQVTVAPPSGASAGLVGGVVGVVALIIGAAAAFIYITLRQKRERRRLHCAGLQGLVAGEPGALDPSLPADEQAELLPYQARWEFPREDLILGKQLGAGAFGVVMKAEARGIVEEEEITTVAVKMLKRGADDAYLRALASELKILVHLGRHLNVVNLLGACTGRIMERELLVIVEYCPFGNIHNYLLRHREGFVDQLDPLTGRVDRTRGAAQLAAAEVAARRQRLVLGTSTDSTPGSGESSIAVTYCPTGDVCTSGSGYDSGGSSVPLSPLPMDDSSSSGGPQPLWRTLYRCDTRAPSKVLCTSDLLSWAFQVASGMKYLAQRKVLHGDLAARNVLLAKDGIVKICDFGLARSMYKSDTYKKKGDGPLPIKWMALESIRDRIFSNQSDVWSFGVVMWELFSLGASPYPGMQPNEEFYNKLLSGYRMDCPQYAPRAVYDLMCACWETDPCCRPTFEKLTSELGDLLDSSMREHFESLMAYEQQRGGLDGDCDYLAMLGSPDYGALTSPDEHVYVNTHPTTTGSQQVVPQPNSNPDPEPTNDYLNMSRPNTPGSQVSFF